MKSSGRYNLLLLLLPIVIIGIGSGLLDYFTPAMGDDLAKWNALGLGSYTHPDRSTISFLAAQYFDCNGRIFDGLGPALTYLLPRDIAAALMGTMTAVYFAFLAAAAGLWHRKRVAAADAIILIALLTLPWWDYMSLRVCQFNYLWSTAFALATVYFYFRTDIRNNFCNLSALLICGGLAAASHEQTGIALSAVFLPLSFSLLLNRSLAKTRASIAIGVALGTIFSISSPALWNRNAEFVRDADTGELLIGTLPFTLLLLIIIIGMSLTRTGRTKLRQLAATSWSAYVAIAVISGLIAVYSTTPGRTGWLPESMAMVALAIMLLDFRRRLSSIWTSVLCISALSLITAHYVVAIKWQYRVGREYNEVIEMYRTSTDGIVYLDATRDTDVPKIALGRVKAVPDADDLYLLEVIRSSYKQNHPLTILPEAFKGQLNSFSDSLTITGYTLYRQAPMTVWFTNPAGNRLSLTADSRVLSLIKAPDGSDIYLASPLIIDPGDHWRPISKQ